MKHSMYTAFWLVLTPRHGPTGTWVLRIAYSISKLGTVYPSWASPGRAVYPWSWRSSLPFATMAGFTNALIDWPEMRMCSPTRLPLSSRPAASLHCEIGR